MSRSILVFGGYESTIPDATLGEQLREIRDQVNDLLEDLEKTDWEDPDENSGIADAFADNVKNLLYGAEAIDQGVTKIRTGD